MPKFILAVFMKFKTIEVIPHDQAMLQAQDRDEFIHTHWAPLAKWVYDNEPDTVSYEAVVADTDPLKIMVYERYANKDAFTEVHRTSQPYLQFKEQQAAWRKDKEVEVTGQSYLTSSVGHFVRS